MCSDAAASSGDGEIRTLDPLLARQVLSQLSYTPTRALCSTSHIRLATHVLVASD